MAATVINVRRFGRCQGNLGPARFRVKVLGFRVLGFRVLGLGD